MSDSPEPPGLYAIARRLELVADVDWCSERSEFDHTTDSRVVRGCEFWYRRKAIADFIEHAANDLRALLDLIETLSVGIVKTIPQSCPSCGAEGVAGQCHWGNHCDGWPEVLQSGEPR